MTILFVILIALASVVLGFLVLVQNPKGGGLAGNIAGFSTQFMGVKQTTDVLEKGTWIFSGVVAVLCIVSTMFISGSGSGIEDRTEKIGTPATTAPQQAPSNQATFPAQPAPATTDSN